MNNQKTKKSRDDKREVYTWITKDRYEKLENVAKRHDMPISTLVRMAVTEMVDKLNKGERIVI